MMTIWDLAAECARVTARWPRWKRIAADDALVSDEARRGARELRDREDEEPRR